jgi:hypothetical protein
MKININVTALHVSQLSSGTVAIVGYGDDGKVLCHLEATPILTLDETSKLQATASIRLNNVIPSDPDSNIL